MSILRMDPETARRRVEQLTPKVLAAVAKIEVAAPDLRAARLDLAFTLLTCALELGVEELGEQAITQDLELLLANWRNRVARSARKPH